MANSTQQDVCCLMGDPVAGNPTQYMLEKAFEVADLDWRFLTFQVPSEQFETALNGARVFDFRGVMLAAPHRGQVGRHLESVTAAARLSNQVNCLVRQDGELRGHNTEGQALRRLVEQLGPVAGSRATILGSGRLARSFAAELALAGAASIELICLEPPQADPLLAALAADGQTETTECSAVPWPAKGEQVAVSDECQLLINATPIGRLDPQAAVPVAIDRLPRDMVVADIVVNPPTTRLVRDARAQGLQIIDGLTLLVEQAAAAFELWTSRQCDRDAMRDAVEEFLVL